MTKKIDPATAPTSAGTLYPSPYDQPCRARRKVKLGDAAGLTQFGVNQCRLPPGAWSSQRHWHTDEDEFIYVLEGEVTLVTDDGEEVLRAGDSAGFKAGDPDGHCFQNRSDSDVVLLEVGTRAMQGEAFYPGLDLKVETGNPNYLHLDGTPYPREPRKT